MPRDYLTDFAILKTVYAADTSDSLPLALGKATYLAMQHPERVVLNRSIRKLVDSVPKLGVVMALEVLTAVGMKEAQHAND